VADIQGHDDQDPSGQREQPAWQKTRNRPAAGQGQGAGQPSALEDLVEGWAAGGQIGHQPVDLARGGLGGSAKSIRFRLRS